MNDPSKFAKELDRRVVQRAHQAVELVQELFSKADDVEALTEVWNLVTALRGPDFHSDSMVGEEPELDVSNRMRIKDAYTVTVRSAVLKGEARDKINFNLAFVVPVRGYSDAERQEMIESLEKPACFDRVHYMSHVRAALGVIECAKKFEAAAETN